MHPIAAIIQRELLGRRAVMLPSIGTLCLVRQGAQLTDNGARLMPPIERVEIDTQASALSILDAICFWLHINEYQAIDLYNQWFDTASENDQIIEIESVGTIFLEESRFEQTLEFSQQLNPFAERRLLVAAYTNRKTPAELRRPTRRSNSTLLSLSIVVAALAVLFIIYLVLNQLGLIQNLFKF